jgi:hypothetical protein
VRPGRRSRCSAWAARPPITLFNSASARIGGHDLGGGTAALTAAFGPVSAFARKAATPRDAALVATLTPGHYTVRVSGVAATTATALVEVYEVP